MLVGEKERVMVGVGAAWIESACAVDVDEA
jgi:hypothetical protein